MKVFLTQETNLEKSRTSLVVAISDQLSEYFDGLNYGSTIVEIGIGLICVKPEFDFFFRPRKVRYIRNKKSIHRVDDGSIAYSLCYDIKLDFSLCKEMSLIEFELFLISELLNSVHELSTNFKPKEGFDIGRFQLDFRDFVSSRNLQVV